MTSFQKCYRSLCRNTNVLNYSAPLFKQQHLNYSRLFSSSVAPSTTNATATVNSSGSTGSTGNSPAASPSEGTFEKVSQHFHNSNNCSLSESLSDSLSENPLSSPSSSSNTSTGIDLPAPELVTMAQEMIQDVFDSNNSLDRKL